MIDHKGMVSISNQKELNYAFDLFITNKVVRAEYGLNNYNYIKKNKGAVIQILKFLRN